MSYKKIVFIVSFLVVFGFTFNFGTPSVKAMTVPELQTLIQQLRRQVAELEMQLLIQQLRQQIVDLQRRIQAQQGVPTTPSPVPVVTTIRIPVIDWGGASSDRDKWDENTTRRAFDTGELVGCGDRIAYIEKKIEGTTQPLTAIYRELFKERSRLTEGTKYFNPIAFNLGDRSIDGHKYRSLQFDRVIVKDGIATVHLTGDYITIGTCEPAQTEAVIKFAAKQFPWIKEVRIYINGVRAKFVHGGGGE